MHKTNMKVKAKFYKTDPKHQCATLRVEGTLGIADPCYVIPGVKWSLFLRAYYVAIGSPDGNQNRHGHSCVFVFEGVPFRVKDTGGDGVFKGVSVDAGMLAVFPLRAARCQFGFDMLPV